MKYVPRPYQLPMTNFVIDNPRCNLFAGMGVGKTPATLAAIDSILMLTDIERVLVVAPKRVAQSTWPGEVLRFTTFSHLSVAVAVGDEKTRSAAVESDAQIVCINYDVLEWLVEKYGANWPFGMIVLDESTRVRSLRVSLQKTKAGKEFLRGQGGKRAKALARVAISDKVQRVVNLSGTPAPNGVEDLWAQLFMLDRGQRLGTSHTAFTNRWFRAIPGSGGRSGYDKIEPMPHAAEQIKAAISDITMAVEAKDHFDLPPLIENIIRVELPPAARKQYKEMEQELFTYINDHPLEAMSAGTKSQKLLQIASGAAYINDEGDWTLVHDAKIEALASVIEEAAGMPVLVAYHFKSDLARILKAFPKARKLDAKPETIEQWNRGEIPILVCHPLSAGHGLSLQHGGNIVCFFSTNWSLEADQQFQERNGPTRQAQSGYNRPVFLHRIVAAGTVEEVAVKRLATKASVQESLMEAMKKSL